MSRASAEWAIVDLPDAERPVSHTVHPGPPVTSDLASEGTAPWCQVTPPDASVTVRGR